MGIVWVPVQHQPFPRACIGQKLRHRLPCGPHELDLLPKLCNFFLFSNFCNVAALTWKMCEIKLNSLSWASEPAWSIGLFFAEFFYFTKNSCWLLFNILMTWKNQGVNAQPFLTAFVTALTTTLEKFLWLQIQFQLFIGNCPQCIEAEPLIVLLVIKRGLRVAKSTVIPLDW